MALCEGQDYHCYPQLTTQEFTEVCHHLYDKYCQASLGPLRRRWKLNLHRTLDLSSVATSDYIPYIEITRPLRAADNSGLESQLSRVTLGGGASELDELGSDAMEMEAMDEEALSRPSEGPNHGYVKYEIHLHPTYQAPCLWFSLHGMPATEPAFDIDTVFRRLVPDAFKEPLRGNGPIGGISAEHHPLTGIPCFFVHPCFLGDAMVGFGCSKEAYLLVWLGLVGGCVGLWVPKEMVMASPAPS